MPTAACMHGPRPFMFHQDHSFMFRYKWSGKTIYDNITSPGDHLCCHKWSPWTTYAQTIYVVIVQLVKDSIFSVWVQGI